MAEHEMIPAFDGSRLPHVGTYRRVLPVNLIRMYENALDWEHLPHVHASSFASIGIVDAGSWGWRAEVVNARGARSVIELRLDRTCRRWITRTLDGPNAGSEIWTHAFPIGADRVDIVVDFFVPGVSAADRHKVGGAFAALYERLYDEDVAMMVERQRQLDRRIEPAQEGGASLSLGARQSLTLPLECELGGRRFVVREVAGDLCAYPALCPHQLGPLSDAPVVDGVVRCPWHGYGFDVRSGSCVTGQKLKLPPGPVISDRDGEVLLTLGKR